MYHWSKNGFEYDSLTALEKRVMSKDRFEHLVGMLQSGERKPHSRLYVIAKEVKKETPVQQLLPWEEPQKTTPTEKVTVITPDDKQALLRKLVDLLS